MKQNSQKQQPPRGICENNTAVRPESHTPQQMKRKVKGKEIHRFEPRDIDRNSFS